MIKLRDHAELDDLVAAMPEIKAATEGVDLGGMIRDNNAYLAFALYKLAYHRDRDGCMCRLYPKLLYYDPELEAQAGNVHSLAHGRWACTVCGGAFDVKYGEDHASWWEWTPSD